MTADSAEGAARAIEYIKEHYGKAVTWGQILDPEGARWRKARADAMQIPLGNAISSYESVMTRVGLLGELAALHGPHRNSARSRYAHCRGCDFEGFDGEEPDWPCRTAEAIATYEGIDLTDMHLYRWDTE